MEGVRMESVKTLKGRIIEMLRLDPVHPQLDVTVEGDAIVVEGMVEGIAQKKRAILTAMKYGDFTGVVDRLRVRPSKEMTDDEIREHIEDAFDGESTLSGLGLAVEVSDGVVDIEGTVGSLTHKRLAGVLAWWVPGTMDVINSLEVDPPEEDTDDEVKDAVRTVLEKDRLVDASRITISARDWVVTLRGAVASPAAKDAAEDDAWYVWGVNEVKNEIKVIPGAR